MLKEGKCGTLGVLLLPRDSALYLALARSSIRRVYVTGDSVVLARS